MTTPKIAKISLAKFTAQDYHLYHQVLSDETVMKSVTGKAIDNDEIKRAFDTVLMSNTEHDNFGYFKIYHHDKYAGFVKFKLYEQNLAELGYFILPQFWHKGIANFIISHFIDIAKDKNINLFATVNKQNAISKHLLTKYGFVYQHDDMVDGLVGEYWRLNFK
ncbi:GNAT family N-acetyltransferase [Moraxella nasovis]|uniref:GNAT family N-acetyltransferase n=1 Tax=Moraxella nasovis TaxID=2904121 RepID=UPI001F61778F|nr:GNAT family N-acetyltransferase [Moraxella nasovis]UNU74031.1 GNAT family N-acetyltransferase [Moraxella nasovis]